MEIVEKIAMKCTREQYESMRQELLNANVKESSQLFDFYDNSNIYLTNDYGGDELCFTCCLYDRKVYKTFDKDVFLKACGINPDKILFDQVKEYFKDAVDVVSLLGTKFLIKDCNFNTLELDGKTVYVKRKGSHDVALYDLETKQYAKIVNTTQPQLSVSLNSSKNWIEDITWWGGKSVTPEILRELTEPNNEPKRFKVGGIYKGKQTEKEYATLLKITSDDGIMISGYGFVNNKFIENQKLYSGSKRLSAIERLQETTQKKWEKALLKYKK